MGSLRHALSEMTERKRLPEHPDCIETLRGEYGHTIEILDSPCPIEGYTCAVHAFQLTDDPTYIQVASFGSGQTFAGAEFVTFLMKTGLLASRRSLVLPGDLIVYLDCGKFRHVGRMKTETRVVSKWGTGCLYEHQIWEVPATYGDEIQHFVGIDADASLDLFIQYAESKGFRFGRRIPVNHGRP